MTRRVRSIVTSIAIVAGLLPALALTASSPAGAVGCSPSASVICIGTSTLASGTVGSAYNQALIESGGTGTITWSLFSGTLPPGLSVNSSGSSSGSITGNPSGAGTFNFTVQAADANHDTATAALSIAVGKGATSVAPLSNPAQSALNQVVTYSAVVSGAGSVSPTATVTFTSSPGGLLCVATLASGNASCQSSAAPMQSGSGSIDTITANYSGDANYLGSSNTTTETVNQGFIATTNITATPSPSSFGQAVTYSATVSSGSGTPTGTVSFTSNPAGSLPGGFLCSATLSAGAASCVVSGAPGGTDTISGAYSGTWDNTAMTGFDGSTGTTTLTVTPASTTMTASVSTPTSTFGQSITYSTTVSSSAGTPTGTVSFATVAGPLCMATLSSGAGSCMSGAAPVGADTAVASYAGTANFAANSATAPVTVSSASTTTAVVVSPTTSTFGASVTYSATVSVVSPGVGPATGSVTFTTSGGSVTLCMVTLSAGVGSCTATNAPVGTDTITGNFGASTNFNASSGTNTLTVSRATPVMTASAIPSSQSLGNSVSYSAHVTSTVATPTGTVAFAIFGPGGEVTLCSNTLSGGVATCSSSVAPLGANQNVAAVYEGDTDFASTAVTTSLTITKGVTNTAVSVNPNTDNFGTSVTYSVTVTSVGGTPTGTVSVSTGGNPLCTVTSLSAGAGSCTATSAPLGSDTITATYNGDGSFLTSSGTTTLNVISAAITTLTVTPNPSATQLNQTVSYGVTVSSMGGTPTGSVVLTTDGGSTSLCTATLSGGSGSCTASNAPIGTDTITGTYAGTLDFAASTGTAPLIVSTDSTTTSVSVAPTHSTFGQSVTYSATVTNDVSGTPTGSVTFSIGGTTLCSILSLSSGSGSCNSSNAILGSDIVTANYSGDSTSAASTGTGSVTVTPASSSTAPMVAPTSSSFGSAVTLSATVTSAGGTPSGSVDFTTGGLELCTGNLSGGTVSCMASNAPAGTDTITATYSGSADFNPSSSNAATLTVSQDTTTTSLSIMPSSTIFGTSVTFSATVSSSGGTPTGSVAVTVGAQPLCSITLALGSGSCNASNAPAGSDTITATYSGDTNFLTSNDTAPLGVGQAASATTISASPSPSHFGTIVRYSATVTSGGGIPTGSVVVTSGATSLCTITLSGGAGSCQAGNAPQGSDTILATYGGDPNFSGSTNTTNLTVGQALTTLTATVQPSAVLVGQPVALSASISSLGGTPTGTITFSTSGGAVLLCSAPLSGSVANCSETTAPVGVDAVTALYGGTGAFAPTSSSPVTLDVGPPAPPPPAGASASNQATSPSTGGSATAQLPGAQVTGQGQGALTLSSFAADPKGPAVAQGTGIFLAVSQVGFTAENGSVCNLGVGKSLVYWNGTAWVPLPSQQLSTPSGCISFTLTPTSTPSIGGSSPTTIYLAVTQQVGPEAGSGYWLAASDGGIFGFGDAAFFGSTGAIHLNQPIVGMAPTPDSQGYWLVASDGGIFAFGDATFYGSTGAIHLNKPIVGMTVTPDGKGYWLVASDGGIFAFGDAVFHGSTGAIHLNQPIVAMTTTPSGKGYWLVASDGGIFAFGDAVFHGSTGAIHLNQPIVGMATTPTGQGYWLVASDGGIFVFGNAVFHGSTGAIHLNQPIVSASASVTGNGYYLVAADGGIFNFGDAKFYGSAGGTHLNRPIVTMAVG